MTSLGFEIGVDECGWGSIAGPLVVCVVALRVDTPGVERFKDSKTLTPRKRKALVQHVGTIPHEAHVVSLSASEVDKLGPARALLLAYRRALGYFLNRHPTASVWIDGCPSAGLKDWLQHRGASWTAQPDGDKTWPCVSMASVLGKEHHDATMRALHEQHPQYGWDSNVGYGAAKHLQAMLEHGITDHHRRTYAPVQQVHRKLGGSVDPAWVSRKPL